ncbi:MAG: S-layer protein precursor [Candidatus Methanofastidiosum methylothiophilum]|uniref:S-layer protein n=1 Tax=Candidatus Methanofastidiosum methylothiophilum TaxID=1705564 RepID=A0A150J9G7_9EURY|nr:MAG: S-layer protein precursor [Candidatus Methanofastidiosum methylthiophilus]
MKNKISGTVCILVIVLSIGNFLLVYGENLTSIREQVFGNVYGGVYYLLEGDIIKVEVSCRITPFPPKDGCDLTAFYAYLGNDSYFEGGNVTSLPREFNIPKTGYYFICVKTDHYMRVTRISSNSSSSIQKTTPNQAVKQNSSKENGYYALDTSLNINGPSKSWWINQSTGSPNVIIVVGALASDVDVRTANILATAISNMGASKSENLVKLDIEFNSFTNNKNVILIGGPIENSIVKDLVDMGASTVDWSKSSGEWEWIADPFAKGYDVLIIYKPEEGVLARNGQFVVREVLPVPISYVKPTKDHYYKRSQKVENLFYNLSDKDSDGVPDKYDTNPNGSGGTSYTYFSWDDNGLLRTWELEAPSDVVEFYDEARPEFYSVDQWITSFVVPNDKISEVLAQAFSKISKGYKDEDKVTLVLKFVQELEYSYDDKTITKEDDFYDYPRYPSQTLFDRTGDCEDTSILLAALLNEMGKDVCLINPPGHMATGVLLPQFSPNYSASYYTINGKEYFYCETTGENWKIGQIPDDYISATATIYEID